MPFSSYTESLRSLADTANSAQWDAVIDTCLRLDVTSAGPVVACCCSSGNDRNFQSFLWPHKSDFCGSAVERFCQSLPKLGRLACPWSSDCKLRRQRQKPPIVTHDQGPMTNDDQLPLNRSAQTSNLLCLWLACCCASQLCAGLQAKALFHLHKVAPYICHTAATASSSCHSIKL